MDNADRYKAALRAVHGRVNEEKMKLLIASDCFYPAVGGVETHIESLANCLLGCGHHVTIVTSRRKNIIGVRMLNKGIKVYYLPWGAAYGLPVAAPGLLSAPLLREIIIREEIEVVHGHQACSTVGGEAILVAKTLGIATVYTDHSLFPVADILGFHVNKLLQMSLLFVDQAIVVSYANKENLMIRSGAPSEFVYVIPNAIDNEMFSPGLDTSSHRKCNEVRIVMVSRLSKRKGCALLQKVVPLTQRSIEGIRVSCTCGKDCLPEVELQFVFGGDGDMGKGLRRFFAKDHRVKFIGALRHEEVPEFLAKGDIYINPSLTETFCIAVLEAALSGLFVVSTNVGGIPEVLPEEFTSLHEPEPEHLAAGLADAVRAFLKRELPGRWSIHKGVKGLYRWEDVTERTEVVYRAALLMNEEREQDLFGAIQGSASWAQWRRWWGARYYCLLSKVFDEDHDLWMRMVAAIYLTLCWVLVAIADIMWPREGILEKVTNTQEGLG